MDTPLISIGITYYKAHDTIERAVLSALAQTWQNIEIIIVDDCSNDGQQAMLDALEGKHPQIRVIHHTQNIGVAAARNTIIAHANGDFLAFFDDDDESLPHRIETQYRRILAYEDVFSKGQPVICHTARTQKYPNGETRYEQTMGTNDGLTPYGDAVALRILTGKPQAHIWGAIATCSQMARLSTYRALNGFDEVFRRSEDTEFNVRAAMSGAHFVGIKIPLVLQTMTLDVDKKLFDEKFYALNLLKKHQAYIEKHARYHFCYAWLTAKYSFLQKAYCDFFLQIFTLALRHPILTAQRFLWALPNIDFNLRLVRFYHDKK